MRRGAIAWVVVTAACGRVDFGRARGDGGSVGDDDAAGDAMSGIDAPPDWTDPAWRARIPIAVGPGPVGALADFPVLVTLPATFDYAATAPDGHDLRFTATDGTPLAYELDTWRPGAASSIWVRVPALDPGGPTALYLYYANAGAPAPGAMTVWLGDVSVHHLGATLADATGSGHDGTALGSPGTVAGVVGDARMFGGSDGISLALPNDYNFTTQLAVSAWFDATTFDTSYQTLVAKGDHAWRMHRNFSTAFLSFATDAGGVAGETTCASTAPTGGWHQLAIVYDGARKKIFLDGVVDRNDAYTSTVDTDAVAVTFGYATQASTPRYFKGALDEIRISASPRSDAWIATEYATVTNPGFVVLGSPQLLP